MQQSSQHKITTLNLDKQFKDLSPNESYYLLNHDVLLNVRTGKGNNTGSGKPLPANERYCDVTQPAGETYTIGGYRSPLTKELYSWHYNSNGVHYILRISNTGCNIVWSRDSDCLSLSSEPKHSIENFRAYLMIEKVCANRDGKQLVWVNGDAPIGQIDVEASIATNFFTTPFFDICPNPCALLQMCVPEICGCITGEFVPLPDTEIGLNNYILDKPIQIAIKHVYYDGRESEWSDRTIPYYQDTRSCFDTQTGFPRCIKFRIPIGNPLVDRIKVGMTNDGVNWFLVDTIEKYKKYNDAQEKWYNRTLSEYVTTSFSNIDCSFDYIFCNDKQKTPIDPKEISRVRNPIPRSPQGLIPVKDSLGFFNYIDGNCPLDKIQVEKLGLQVNCPDSTQDCQNEFVTLTVRAVIHNTRDFFNQFIYRQGGGFDDPDDLTETAYFGGIKDTIPFTQYLTFGQEFKEKTRNFIGYVDGTNYWSEAKQWRSNSTFTTRNETGVLPGMASLPRRIGLNADINSGFFYYQEFKVRVKKGTRGFFRLTSHDSVSGSGVNQNKSTYVGGTISNITLYSSTGDLSSIIDNTVKEVYFEACDGDVTADTVLIIQDDAVDEANSLYNGYITDKNNQPVEGAKIHKDDASLLSITDHNGFYHFYSDQQDITVTIRTELDCSSFNTIQSMSIPSDTGGVAYRHDEIIDSDTYKDDLFLIVKSKVEDCNGDGISGIRVAVSGSKYKVTGSDGVATFKLRNYSTRNRVVRIIVMDINGCISSDCNGGCNPCMPTDTKNAPACFYHTPTLLMSDLTINRDSIAGKRGLKAGGRYPFALVAKGDCGRLSAAYPVKYIDIPKTQVKGRLSFCGLSYNGTGMQLPSWVNCISILRGENINQYVIQWKVDKIEKTSDGKIKITIQSLNDYNTQYNFNTNTTYQWLKGDRVEFIMNGDGSILTTAEHGLLNYLTISPFNDEIISGETDAPANFFNQLLIEDDGRLENVTEGAIIELQRPNEATTEIIYREFCVSIPVENGLLVYPTGTFDSFDTFFVNRAIGPFVGTFESKSPSDFWGTNVSDVGKAHLANLYENERRYGRNISINSPVQANYFGDLIKRFDAPEQGDIIAMNIKDGKIILAICENDNFLAQSADDLVRVGGDGVIRALPPDAIISDAQPKIYGAYGCQYDHVGSIFFGDGFATWCDVNKNAYVKHDYNSAKDVAEGRVQTYFRIRCQEIETHNRSQADPLNKYRFAKGYNFQNGMEYLTIKKLRDSAYNNEKKPYLKKNETICYHPVLDDWFGFASFTPEYYSQFDLFDDTGCAFVSYYNGVPYIHPIVADRFNEFFGIACDEVFGVTVNKLPEKVKEGLAIEIQSEMMWFASEITTERGNFVSEIPPARWKRENGKWNANFLFNRNSRAGLFGNSPGGVPEPTTGYYINVTLVRDNTNGLIYGSINNAKKVLYNETDNVFFKFLVKEQSGFTENL